MSGNPFHNRMNFVGRGKILKRILGKLSKPIPDCLQINGPRQIGKTYLLLKIRDHFSATQDCFFETIYWDLRLHTPRTDEEFCTVFLEQLQTPSLEDYFPKASSIQDIQAGFNILKDESKRVLLILDGMDSLLGSRSQISKNLLDNLREIATNYDMAIVTGSRRSLRDLCKSKETETSTFFGIFNDNFVLACFDEMDLHRFIELFDARPNADLKIDSAIHHWTGGIPALTRLLCEEAWDHSQGSIAISESDIEKAAESMFSRSQCLMDELWDDCPDEQKEIFQSLIAKKADSILANRFVEELKQRGFIIQLGSKFSCATELMKRHVERQSQRNDVLMRIFGTSDLYKSNFPDLLNKLHRQTRLSPDVDDALMEIIEHGQNPSLCLSRFRDFVDSVMDLIWKKESLPKVIPDGWVENWETKKITFFPSGSIAGDRGKQKRLLSFLSGPDTPLKIHISKSSSYLIDHLHNLGNHGQHKEGENIPAGYVYAGCLAAIELCRQLKQELDI